MRILIIGATSAIAKATARLYAEAKHELYLIARDSDRLQQLEKDLQVRGAQIKGQTVLDLEHMDKHPQAIDDAIAALGEIDLALICHGSLPNQEDCESDFELAHREIVINGLSVISLLNPIAKQMQQQGNGTIAVITSVAGDRGRQPNFVYGAAKSLVSTYLQGLRGKMFAHNVHVIDIRPGLVDSPMTAQFDKGLLWSSPEKIAKIIVRSIRWRKHTVYAPGYWRMIMNIVCSIPEFIFKRLKI